MRTTSTAFPRRTKTSRTPGPLVRRNYLTHSSTQVRSLCAGGSTKSQATLHQGVWPQVYTALRCALKEPSHAGTELLSHILPPIQSTPTTKAAV